MVLSVERFVNAGHSADITIVKFMFASTTIYSAVKSWTVERLL